jgi:hypothetical protein
MEVLVETGAASSGVDQRQQLRGTIKEQFVHAVVRVGRLHLRGGKDSLPPRQRAGYELTLFTGSDERVVTSH